MGLLDRLRGGPRDPEARELVRLVRRARKEIQAKLPAYSRSLHKGSDLALEAIAQLERLEGEVREGRATPELYRHTHEAIRTFVPMRAKAAGRSDVPSPRTTGLIQLRNKLMELSTPREGGTGG